MGSKKKKKQAAYLKSGVLRSEWEATYLTSQEKALLDLDFSDGNKSTAHANLKYYQKDFQCLSEWDKERLKTLSAFFQKLTQSSWQEIYASGGKGGSKSGFGYTIHQDLQRLPSQEVVETISPDITFFELRVNQKSRVHGFRTKNAFMLIWLDQHHELYAK